jgi:hypothetical protein
LNWYKKAQGYIATEPYNYPYYLHEIIRMQENGLPLNTMNAAELKHAKELERAGLINKLVRQDKTGKYLVYVINKEKFEERGWSTKTGIR